MDELVYEMLWDCRYCGTRKLLGLTHRHCPHCGAAQDPSSRYFPPDDEKVAVQHHQYVGVDIQCRYCAAACSRRANNCGKCGAGLSAGGQGAPPREVALVQTQLAHEVQAPSSAPRQPPRSGAARVLVPVFALMLVAVVVLLLVWKQDRSFVVASHSWRRSIAVERFGPQRESAWCDSLPAGASEVSRHREQRGEKLVDDGQDCKLEKKDQGDGTFSEQQICSPKHKSEPVYDDKCDFVLAKWSRSREVVTEGSALLPKPHWPALSLSRSGCAAPGCEREGTRSQRYTVVFRDPKGDSFSCDFPQPAWSSFADGQRYAGKLRALVGSLDCGSLVAAR